MEETPRPGMAGEKLEGAALRPKRLTDIAYCGIRIALGVAFIVHGYGKFGNEGFIGWMSTYGISPEFAMLIAAGEFIPGILLVIGVLSRISASIIAVIMLAAMIVIKGLASYAGAEGADAYEYDLMLLAVSLLVIVAGPGSLSLAHKIRSLPRFLH